MLRVLIRAWRGICRWGSSRMVVRIRVMLRILTVVLLRGWSLWVEDVRIFYASGGLVMLMIVGESRAGRRYPVPSHFGGRVAAWVAMVSHVMLIVWIMVVRMF